MDKVDWDRLLDELRQRSSEEWVSLADASRATGVAIPTLRAWYRSGRLPSALVDGPNGPQRIVDLEVAVTLCSASPKFQRRLHELNSLQTQVDELLRRITILEEVVRTRPFTAVDADEERQ
jgi:predicted site-specific integrase-resolvase